MCKPFSLHCVSALTGGEASPGGCNGIRSVCPLPTVETEPRARLATDFMVVMLQTSNTALPAGPSPPRLQQGDVRDQSSRLRFFHRHASINRAWHQAVMLTQLRCQIGGEHGIDCGSSL